MSLPAHRASSDLSQIHQNTDSDWTACSDIFYLLDTVKISYDSPIGKITVEDIRCDNCAECLASLKNVTRSTNCDDCPFMITVCGVTWDVIEHNSEIKQRRIRAIPKAAGLRFFDDNRMSSDAYFYQANRLRLDSLPSDYFTDRQVGEAKAVNQLTPEQFINNLQKNNQQFIAAHGKPLYLHKENFEEPMSDYEKSLTARLVSDNDVV